MNVPGLQCTTLGSVTYNDGLEASDSLVALLSCAGARTKRHHRAYRLVGGRVS